MSHNEHTYKHLFDNSGHLTRDAMVRHLSGQFSKAEREAIEKHLQTCDMCADALEGLKMFRSSLAVERALEQIDDRIDQRDERKSIAPVWRRYAAAAVVLVVMGAGLWLVNDVMLTPADNMAMTREATKENNAKSKAGDTEMGNRQAESTAMTADSIDAAANEEVDVDNYSLELEEELIQVEELEVSQDRNEVAQVPSSGSGDSEFILPRNASSSSYGATNPIPEPNKPVSDDLTDLAPAKEEVTEAETENQNKVTVTGSSNSLGNRSDDRETEESDKSFILDEASETVSLKAQFPGGEQALTKYLEGFEKPESAQGIAGTIYVTFTVKGNGKIKQLEIERGLQDELDTALKKYLADMPNWQPATVNGEPVNEQVNLPIKIK